MRLGSYDFMLLCAIFGRSRPDLSLFACSEDREERLFNILECRLNAMRFEYPPDTRFHLCRIAKAREKIVGREPSTAFGIHPFARAEDMASREQLEDRIANPRLFPQDLKIARCRRNRDFGWAGIVHFSGIPDNTPSRNKRQKNAESP